MFSRLDIEEQLNCLNGVQKDAVCTTEGPLLILAGAGSGKTRVLTYRIAYLINMGKCLPDEILAITFTNKAAEEMKNRLRELLHIPDKLWISTFHAAGARILRSAINNLGYERNFNIIDTQDQLNLIKECLREQNLDFDIYHPRKVLSIISKAKNELEDEVSYEKNARDFFACKVSDVFILYQKKLKESNCLDFDDLLLLTVKLFQEKPELLNYYQNQFRYILVDEYQDTNMAQYVLVKMLAEKYRNLCVVGDDDQSIYQFRGADIRNILEFEKDYPEAKTVKLEENYRSQRNILEAAFHVVKNNSGRKEKRLWTRKSDGEKVYYFCGRDEREEARFVVDEIKSNQDKFENFAVLYRTNAQSRVLEEILVRENIPYSLYGGIRFYERMEIKDILAYLKLIDNLNDNISLKRIINVPRRGIGKKTMEKLENYALSEGINLFKALQESEKAGISAGIRKKIDEFYHCINNFYNMGEFLSVQELVEKIIEDTGYLDALEAEGTFEARSRMENIKEFVSAAQEFDVSGEGKSLTYFLTEVSLVSSMEVIGETEEDKRVFCMTLHAAKGLEFSVVFIIGLEETLFPHSFSLENPEDLDEERRLFYVGCTRAMNRLYLTHARERSFYGRRTSNLSSRFLEEIPEELIGFASGDKDKEWGKREGAEPLLKKEDTERFLENESWSVGDNVYHKKWGNGIIKKTGVSGEDQVLTVQFPEVGTKVIMATYAPLKKV